LQSALTPLIRFTIRTLLSLLVIAVVLAGGRFLLDEGRVWQSSQGDLQTLTSAHASVASYREDMHSGVTARMAQARKESLAQIDRRIVEVRAEQDRYATLRNTSAFSLPLVGPDKFAERVSARFNSAVMAEILRQELAYLQQLKGIIESGRAAAERDYRKARATLLAGQQEWNDLNPVDVFRLQHPELIGGELEKLRARLTRAQADYIRARKRYEDQATSQAALPGFAVDQQALDAVTKDLSDRLEQAGTAVTANWFARYLSPVLRVLPVALVVLLSSFAAHLFIKLLFYYVLAPLAARRKPIQLEAAPAVQGIHASASAVSQEIRLEPNEELLILPDFLQSSSTSAIKNTRLVLDWSCLWTSIISGMVMLTRIRTSSRDDHVVVSSDADAVSEIALVTIPGGAAMVFQPHGLVGVVYPSATPLKIDRRWRLFSAHAWLTLQLRYLVFRGPVTLIVKGTRGVRVEPAGRGRIISQFATLGFSAHLHYATVRSETFWPYYQGQAPLLQDKFDGANGYYVYDETPRYGKAGGFFSRGLEGLTDAVMKVFGI
jgi:hypothetical protein